MKGKEKKTKDGKKEDNQADDELHYDISKSFEAKENVISSSSALNIFIILLKLDLILYRIKKIIQKRSRIRIRLKSMIQEKENQKRKIN